MEFKVDAQQNRFGLGYAIVKPFRMAASEESVMEQLLCSLASLHRNFQKHKEMNVTEDEANAVVQRVVASDAVGVGKNQPVGVALAPVHTYVDQLGKTPRPWSSSIVVPPFACHWGIVVGTPDDLTLFHLLFTNDIGPNAGSSNVENRLIRFHYKSIEGPLADTTYVGQTRYNINQLSALGRAMIREFGSYHKLFWNCQTFAKCYLRVITGDHDATFDHWTSADTSRLFLCAFLVGAPAATTNKAKETVQMNRLIRKIDSIPKNLPAEDASAQTITAIYEMLKQDPLWGRDVGQLEDTIDKSGFLNRLWNILFGKDD